MRSYWMMGAAFTVAATPCWAENRSPIANAPLRLTGGGALPVIAAPGRVPIFDRAPMAAYHVPTSIDVRASALAPAPFVEGKRSIASTDQRAATMAMGISRVPGVGRRARRSMFDTMLVLRFSGASAMPRVELGGGVAGVAWHGAMLGLGRQKMKHNDAR